MLRMPVRLLAFGPPPPCFGGYSGHLLYETNFFFFRCWIGAFTAIQPSFPPFSQFPFSFCNDEAPQSPLGSPFTSERNFCFSERFRSPPEIFFPMFETLVCSFLLFFPSLFFSTVHVVSTWMFFLFFKEILALFLDPLYFKLFNPIFLPPAVGFYRVLVLERGIQYMRGLASFFRKKRSNRSLFSSIIFFVP